MSRTKKMGWDWYLAPWLIYALGVFAISCAMGMQFAAGRQYEREGWKGVRKDVLENLADKMQDRHDEYADDYSIEEAYHNAKRDLEEAKAAYEQGVANLEEARQLVLKTSNYGKKL